MDIRSSVMLKELMAAQGPLTSEYFAQLNRVTSRTAREDVKHINDTLMHHGAEVQSLKGKGYILMIEDEAAFKSFLEKEFQTTAVSPSSFPDFPEERVRFLIKRLLLSNTFLKLENLADELLISKSTIQNDIRMVKNIFKKYDITLEKRPNYGLKAVGNEFKLRFCMSEYVFAEREGVTNDIFDSQLPGLIKENVNDIWDIILAESQASNITLSDIAMNNLFIHIAITYKRVETGHHITLYPREFKDIKSKEEYKTAERIVSKLEAKLHITFPEVEVAYIAIHLLGTKMISQTNLSDQEVEEVLDIPIYQLAHSILEAIENKMGLGIRQDKELLVGLGLHLKPAINRYKYGMNIRNPLLSDIKMNYPVAFEAGIIAGLVLEEYMGVNIEEGEIGYIALHIGAAMERKKVHSGPKRCMVVCASGAGSAQLIFYKLKSQFGSRLEVVGTTEYYKLNQISFANIDFIVSTIPIAEKLPVPIVQVKTILGEGDLERIEGHVAEQHSNITDYLKQDLFYFQKAFSTREDVLTFLTKELQEKNLVQDDYMEQLMERENIAPTSFWNLVALPHPVTTQTDETFLTVCTLQRPINWGEKRVQLIFLLNVEKGDTQDLQTLYKALRYIVDNISVVQRILKCRSYEDFLKVLKNQQP